MYDRIPNHNRLDNWLDSLCSGLRLCYSYAKAFSADRERVEAALIFEMQPPFNTEYTKEFIYEDTEIKTSGRNSLLPDSFTLKKDAKR